MSKNPTRLIYNVKVTSNSGWAEMICREEEKRRQANFQIVEGNQKWGAWDSTAWGAVVHS